MTIETWVKIDGAPIEIDLEEVDERIAIRIGSVNGDFLSLSFCDPAYVAELARTIAEAGQRLARLLNQRDH